MLIVISPAKTLDFDAKVLVENYSLPSFIDHAENLVNEMRKLQVNEIGQLMGISHNLAQLNFERFLTWHSPFTPQNARQAIFVFRGEVYRGIDIDTWKSEAVLESQSYLRILSGMYGLLRPLDLIQAYRLEMGTALKTAKAKNLYEYWGNKITHQLNEDMKYSTGEKVLINLASNEYFKSISKKELKFNVITPIFKEQKGNNFTTITVYAKKARGLMTRFIIENRISQSDDIKAFDTEGYSFSASMSKNNEWTFVR